MANVPPTRHCYIRTYRPPATTIAPDRDPASPAPVMQRDRGMRALGVGDAGQPGASRSQPRGKSRAISPRRSRSHELSQTGWGHDCRQRVRRLGHCPYHSARHGQALEAHPALPHPRHPLCRPHYCSQPLMPAGQCSSPLAPSLQPVNACLTRCCNTHAAHTLSLGWVGGVGATCQGASPRPQ